MVNSNDTRGSIIGAMAARTADQIGLVVPSLDQALAGWSTHLGTGPWSVWDYVPPFLKWREYRGSEGTFSMRIAFAGSRPQIELIEPLEGPSIYHDFLRTHGAGVHHLGFVVRSYQETCAELRDLGIELLMAGGGHGLDGDGAFGYFDTDVRFGFMLEVMQLPARRPPPRFVYPSEPWPSEPRSRLR